MRWSLSALRRRWQAPAFFVLMACGVGAAVWGPVGPSEILQFGRGLAGDPWVAVGLVVVQIGLYATALPGSLVVWAIAPFYPPLLATLLLATGSTLGAIAAYGVSQSLTAGWRARLQDRFTFRLLARRGDFLVQCMLRTVPGVPHAAINFGGGLLRLPFVPFLLAALLGSTIKWWIYASAIFGLVQAGTEPGVPPVTYLIPLLLVALLFLLAAVMRVWFQGTWGRRAKH
jgi:uncharacterized membrane protein YdjX (TVP38/TMEM64 family)